MSIELSDAHDIVVSYLSQYQLEATQDAMEPLSQIDFKRLVDVYDHEELFLRTRFFDFLEQAYNARTKTEGGSAKVNAKDVRTAMLMLGAAVENADEAQISANNKSVIKDICPYC